MKATLVKKQEGWYNLYQNDIGIGSTHTELQGYKLSLKNCQAIERGYDLDELAKIEYPICEVWNDEEALIRELAFKKGFQKALEILGDKRFSEKDMSKMMLATSEWLNSEIEYGADELIKKVIQSIQQTEWDVEIEMGYVGECNGNNDNGCFQDSSGHNCGCFKRKPKLDSNGCLILKICQ